MLADLSGTKTYALRDTVTAGPGKVLTYNCTLLKYNAGRINAVRFRENMEGAVRKSVCADGELKRFIDEDVTVAYAFSARTCSGESQAGKLPA